MKAAIIGGGVIGGGWAARFLLNGWDVAVHDPDPDARRKIGEVLDNARAALPALYDVALPREGRLSFGASLAEVVKNALWIQESAPERLDLKHRIFNDLADLTDVNTVVGSSTSGFRPSDLQAGAENAGKLSGQIPGQISGQILVAHPFNPVYLLPLVELVPSPITRPEITERAREILTGLGMKPLVIRKEIDGHVADRLLESLWREALWLVHDGIATTEEIDDAIRYGFGLRWGQMGLFETYRIAGGEAGMRHFLTQFGPALAWPWSKLTDVPPFDDRLIDLIAGQSDAQSGHMSIRALERLRDTNLVAMIRALKAGGSAAGGTVAAHEKTLHMETAAPLPVTVDRVVPPTWTDYNGHMNETHYLEVGAQATDNFMAMIGADADYIAAGQSYFTVETHIRHRAEVRAGEKMKVTTQVITGEGKKLHLFHSLYGGEEARLSATVETFLLHVDLKTRASSPPGARVVDGLKPYTEAHANLPLPKGAGRAVGQRD